MIRLRIVLEILWYLVKNRALNPFLKKRSGQILLALITSLYIINAYQYLSGIDNDNIYSSLVPLMHRYGLDHYSLTILVSGFLIVYTIYILIQAKPIYLREEEYEILLSQPIDLEEFMLANILSVLVSPLVLVPAFLGLALMGMVFTGDPLRGILVMVGSLIFLSGLIIIEILFKLLARRTRLRLLITVFFTALLFIGAMDSLRRNGFSLILGIPYMSISACLIFPFSRSISLADILLILVLGYAEIAGFSLIASVFSKRIGIEDLSPKTPANIKLLEGQKPLIKYGSPRKILYSYLFISRILNRRHLLGLSIFVVIACIAGLLARRVAGIPMEASGYFVEVFVPLMIGMALYTESSYVLAMDLRCYWLYRTYAIDMAPVAGAIVLKLATHSVEAATVMFAGLSLYMDKAQLLFMIPLYFPAGILGASLELISLSYLASKRQVIRETMAGIYTVEGLTAVLLEIIVIAVFMAISGLAFYLSSQSLLVLIIGGIASIGISYPLLRFAERIIGDMMNYYDVLI